MTMTPNEILTRLRSRVRAIEPVVLPGTDLALGLVVLTQAEHQQAVFATDRWFKRSDLEPRPLTVDAWNCEMATQVLALALVLPEPDEQAGVTTYRVRKS